MRILTRFHKSRFHQQGFIRRDILQLYTTRIMMTMSKMFCLFLCLGCAVAQSSSDEEEQAQCDQCDNAGPASEFTECDGCGDIVCDDCRECGEDCFVCRDARTALVNAPAVLGNSTDTPSTETESDESWTESGTTAHYGVPRQDAIAAAGKISCVRIVSLFIFFYMF